MNHVCVRLCDIECELTVASRRTADITQLISILIASVCNFLRGLTALESLGLFIVVVSRLNSGTLHLVRLVWMNIGLSQRPLPEKKHNTPMRHIYASGEIRSRNPREKVPQNYTVDGTVTGTAQPVHLKDKK